MKITVLGPLIFVLLVSVFVYQGEGYTVSKHKYWKRSYYTRCSYGYAWYGHYGSKRCKRYYRDYPSYRYYRHYDHDALPYYRFIAVMENLFKAHRSPGHIARSLRDVLIKLDESNSEMKASKIERLLTSAKSILCNLDDNPRLFDKSNPVTQLSNEFAYAEIVPLLITRLHLLSFESRKKVAVVLINLLKRKIGFRSPTAELLIKHPDVLVTLIEGYENPDIALICGIILRECGQHGRLAMAIFEIEQFYNLFSYIESPSFEIAADAFRTFKCFIQGNKKLTARFILSNYDHFFAQYQILLTSDNFLTRRQALKLLGEVLNEPLNARIAEKYVQKVHNFRQVMWFLTDESPSIQWEAFEIFKVFLISPLPSKSVTSLLVKNREKLVLFMEEFLAPKKGDPQMTKEKVEVIAQLQQIGI